MSIIVNNLTKIYGNQIAVNNISFAINKGEIVGFLGPNGAGKSTTMKIITGYINADKGYAEVCNIKVGENNNESKNKIGYLPEANHLYNEMYVKEYLEFIASIHQIKDKQNAINKTILQVGLQIEASKKIGQLSKGYKQRVGIAAALIHNPEVLILDEPTSGLDPNQIIEIREVIKNLGKNKTILFSSHIMQEVEAICDRVIIINNGEIVANDTLNNLQKGSKENHIVVVIFKEKLQPQELNKIENIKEKKSSSNFEYQIATSNPDEVRKKILQLSVDNNLNIISLQSKSNSLEEVFKSLTK